MPKSIFRQVLDASTVGLSLVLATVIGLLIGLFLDGKFGTSPWFTLIFFILGVIAGFKELFRMVKKLDDGPDKEDP